jgi:hypothetical protein
MKIYYWFTKSWWQYLLAKPTDPTYTNWFNRTLCRMHGHPEGPWYYNANGFEPDMTCKNCGDELG